MKERLNLLLAISRAKRLAFRSRFAGQVLPAITLAREEELGTSIALTGNYIQVRIPGLTVPPNRLVNVRIENVRPPQRPPQDIRIDRIEDRIEGIEDIRPNVRPDATFGRIV